MIQENVWLFRKPPLLGPPSSLPDACWLCPGCWPAPQPVSRLASSGAILYYNIQYYDVLQYTILYYTILYYAIPYHTIPYHTNTITMTQAVTLTLAHTHTHTYDSSRGTNDGFEKHTPPTVWGEECKQATPSFMYPACQKRNVFISRRRQRSSFPDRDSGDVHRGSGGFFANVTKTLGTCLIVIVSLLYHMR